MCSESKQSSVDQASLHRSETWLIGAWQQLHIDITATFHSLQKSGPVLTKGCNEFKFNSVSLQSMGVISFLLRQYCQH
jgi:hypothetical protein